MYRPNLNPPNNVNYCSRFLCVAAFAIFFFTLPVMALKSDIEKPVHINADSVLFNKEKGLAVYEGNVNITQGTLEIRAGKIEIKAPDNEIEKISASGKPVSFKQKMDDGKLSLGGANRIVYLIKTKHLIMDGNAYISNGKDKFSSNHIEYSLRTGELKAGDKKAPGKSRVNVIFYPTNKAN